MMKKLKSLGSDARHLFRAKIAKFGERPRWSKFEPTIVLENVKHWPSNERVAHKLWFFLSKTFLRADKLEPGNWIEFEARAVVRHTGYRGPDQQLRRAYRGRIKWTLTRPSKVRKVNPHEMALPPKTETAISNSVSQSEQRITKS